MQETNTTSETNAVAISNQKGGAGKTTTTIHLAGALNARDQRVLVVDLDKQGGLTNAFGFSDVYYDLERETTLYEVLFDIKSGPSVNDLVQEGEEFDVVPATERFMNQSNISQLAEAGRSRERLQLVFDQLDSPYDWILVDTAPDLNVLTDNAIVATGNLLVPFFPEELNKNSLRLLLKQLRNLEQLYGDVNDLALIASRVERNNEHRRVVDDVREGFEMPVFEIPKRTDLSKAISNGSTIFEYGDEDNDRIRDARRSFDAIADLLERELR